MVRTESRVRAVAYMALTVDSKELPELIVRSRSSRQTVELEVDGKRITVRVDELKAAIRSCE
jgi:hypothetical protein